MGNLSIIQIEELMDNIIGQQISNHLEFIGFTITDNSKGDSCKFEAKIAEWNTPNLGLFIDKDDFVFIECSYGWWKDEILSFIDFHDLIQKINQSTLFSRWYPEKSDERTEVKINIETWTLGYKKDVFGTIIDSFISDVHANIPKFYDEFQSFRKK